MFFSNCKIVLIALYLFTLKNVYSEEAKNEKDYSLKLKGWEKMDENNPYIDYRAVKMKKLNRTHYVMDGTVEVLRDDISKEDLLITILGAQKKSNGYQQSSLVQLEKKNFCEYVKTEKMVMEDIIKCSNITKIMEECPPPKGVYSISKYMPDPEKLPNSLPINYWRFTLINQLGDTQLSGIHVFVDVEKKAPGT